MLKADTNGGRICDTCRSAHGTIYCQADSAYLCTGCDARVHAVNQVGSRHERVWVCEACEHAPAAFICKADSAMLCAMCDSDIHSANPLAQRHHRVPVLPIPGAENQFLTREFEETISDEDAEEAASWLYNNSVKNSSNQGNINVVLFGGEVVDEYLDLNDYNSDQHTRFPEQYDNQFGDQKRRNDSVVPVQSGETKNQLQHQSFQLGMDYDAPNLGFAFPAPFSHSVSVSSLDVAVVPDSSSDGGSISHPTPQKGTIDLISTHPPQLTPMDREARVLKYREKKKMRKFEKTIRYASRKAYAETRPRIKGRFAKRADMEAEANYMFSKTLMADNGYVVPSY